VTDIPRINQTLQSELRARRMRRVGAVEAATWLDAAGVLTDSPTKPGRPLRDLLRLRKGLISGQRQEMNGRWFIDLVEASAPITSSRDHEIKTTRAVVPLVSLAQVVRGLSAEKDDIRNATNALTTGPLYTIAQLANLPGDAIDKPGVYSIWCEDGDAVSAISHALGPPIDPGLLYVGDTGARTGSKGTLRRRIGRNHFGSSANASGSTLRLTVGAILRAHLDLVPHETNSGRVQFDPESEKTLTRWMGRYLSIRVWPARSVQALTGMETRLLAKLEPPLSLQRAANSPHAGTISRLRKEVGRRARAARTE